MSSSLRVPEEMVRSWVQGLAPRTDLRGAPAVAKEMEAALAKAGGDGYVVLGRHQLFTWGEALQGIARRAPLGSPAQSVSDDIRAILGGREGAAAPSASVVATPAAPPSSREWTPPSAYAPPAPVTYTRAPATTGGQAATGNLRLVAEAEIPSVVANLLREARRELLVVSPWTLGLETLAPELVRTPASVGLRIVSRRADREDEAYHRALRDLQRRGAELVMSPFLHTRMVLADGEALLLGAAGLPKAGFNVQREAAILTSEPQTLAAARAHFERILDEARRGPPR